MKICLKKDNLMVSSANMKREIGIRGRDIFDRLYKIEMYVACFGWVFNRGISFCSRGRWRLGCKSRRGKRPGSRR